MICSRVVCQLPSLICHSVRVVNVDDKLVAAFSADWKRSVSLAIEAVIVSCNEAGITCELLLEHRMLILD